MKALKRLSLLVFCMLVWGCGSQQSQASDKTSVIIDVNSNKAKQLIKENNLIIIDVRTPQEYNAGHLKDAKNINISDKNFRSRIENLDKNDSYLVYCRTGSRSRHTIGLMKELNFKSVYHLEDGIAEWVREGNPVVK